MIDSEIEEVIESYLKSLKSKLPDSFEAEDLIEDLRAHIIESFNDKREQFPQYTDSQIMQRVLDELGEPEDIAQEYGIELGEEEPLEMRRSKGIRVLARLFIAIIVTVICSWIVSVMTEGRVDFWLSLVVLMVFAIAEWFVRAWQAGESSPFDILRSKD